MSIRKYVSVVVALVVLNSTVLTGCTSADDVSFSSQTCAESTLITTEPTTVATTTPATEPTTVAATAPATEATTVATTPATEPTTVAATTSATEATTVATTTPATEPSTISITIPESDPVEQYWVTTWCAAPMKLDQSEIPGNSSLSGSTVRQIVHLSLGGDSFTFTFSNEYGLSSLDIEAVYISEISNVYKSNIQTDTTVQLTFNGGEERITLGPKETVTSDPVDFSCEELGNIAVSMELGRMVPTIVTGHAFANTYCWVSSGKHGTDDAIETSSPYKSGYFLSKVNVCTDIDAGAVVCFGDSITDGVGSDENQFNDYPDILADLMLADVGTSHLAVVNAGIGGNRLINTACAGDMGIIRFKRDILDVEGVKYAIIFIGANDIGAANGATYQEMLEGYETVVAACHEKDIKVYAATITPLKKSAYDTDFHRMLLNDLNSYLKSDDSVFDGVIDFYAAVEDSENPETIAEEYNCPWGDYLHLGARGYAKLAQTAFEFLKNQI